MLLCFQHPFFLGNFITIIELKTKLCLETKVISLVSVQNNSAIVQVRHCQVRQLPGLDYTDPRVEILVDVKDDRSKVKLTLDIGTEPGLSDVMAGYEMGGPQIVITEVSKVIDLF